MYVLGFNEVSRDLWAKVVEVFRVDPVDFSAFCLKNAAKPTGMKAVLGIVSKIIPKIYSVLRLKLFTSSGFG